MSRSKSSILIRENISLAVSICAFLLSALAFWISWENQQFKRLISFEQRKHEILQTSFEIENLYRALEFEAIRLNASEGLLDQIRQGHEGWNATLITSLPPSSDIGDRLFLECLGQKTTSIYLLTQANLKNLREQTRLSP